MNREDNQSDANRYGHVKSCVFTWAFASNERRTSSKRISECMVESEFLRCSFRATAQINTQLCPSLVIDNRNLIYYEMSSNQIEIGFLCNFGHNLTRTISETEDCWVERNMKYLDLWINERFHWNLNLADKREPLNIFQLWIISYSKREEICLTRIQCWDDFYKYRNYLSVNCRMIFLYEISFGKGCENFWKHKSGIWKRLKISSTQVE